MMCYVCYVCYVCYDMLCVLCVLHCVVICCDMLRCVTMCCDVLRCVVMCCDMLLIVIPVVLLILITILTLCIYNLLSYIVFHLPLYYIWHSCTWGMKDHFGASPNPSPRVKTHTWLARVIQEKCHYHMMPRTCHFDEKAYFGEMSLKWSKTPFSCFRAIWWRLFHILGFSRLSCLLRGWYATLF